MNNWRLPTRDELNTMYIQLHKKGMGGFKADYYWSSSEGVNYIAWCQYFGNSAQIFNSKDYKYQVRLIRDLPEAQTCNGLVLFLDGRSFEVAEKDEGIMTWDEAVMCRSGREE
jgi:hypothetical protein